MSAWIPGPWFVKDDDDDAWLSKIYSFDYGTVVCVHSDPSIPGQTDFHDGTAHLIAAAPDLYAALDYAVKHIEIELGYDHDAAVNSRVILAKARGER